LHKGGAITVLTKWKDIFPLIDKEPDYLELLRPQYSGSTPRQLFGDAQEILYEDYKKDKIKMKEYITGKNLKITQNSNFEEFNISINENEAFKEISKTHIQLYYEKLVNKSIREEKEAQKKENKRCTNLFRKIQFNWTMGRVERGIRK